MIKTDRNERCLTVGDHILHSLVYPSKAPIPIITEIAGSIQSSTRKYFATIDLANVSFMAYFDSFSAAVCIYLKNDTMHLYLSTHMASQQHCHLNNLCRTAVVTPSFLWDHGNDIKGMTPCSEEVHLTHSRHKHSQNSSWKGWATTFHIVQTHLSAKFLTPFGSLSPAPSLILSRNSYWPW